MRASLYGRALKIADFKGSQKQTKHVGGSNSNLETNPGEVIGISHVLVHWWNMGEVFSHPSCQIFGRVQW